MNELNINEEKLLQAESSVDDHDVIYTLRTAHQNQTQLIILADQKANILIGIIAVVFTLLFTSADLLKSFDQKAIFTLAGFLFFELVAMLLALFVLLPKNINSRMKNKGVEEIPNPLFFGFFSNYDEKLYCDYLLESIKDNNSARAYLIRDFYQIGLVLRKKYRLLKFAYLFAVIGLIVLFFSIIQFMFFVN